MEKQLLHITVNSEYHELYIKPKRLLVEVIRDELGLTGTKRACNTSSCSACTILLNANEIIRNCFLAELAKWTFLCPFTPSTIVRKYKSQLKEASRTA